jgi:hypothetical protein
LVIEEVDRDLDSPVGCVGRYLFGDLAPCTAQPTMVDAADFGPDGRCVRDDVEGSVAGSHPSGGSDSMERCTASDPFYCEDGFRRSDEGVGALVHRRSPCVVRAAGENSHETLDASNGRDDTDLVAASLQHGPLFNVEFNVGLHIIWIPGHAERLMRIESEG